MSTEVEVPIADRPLQQVHGLSLGKLVARGLTTIDDQLESETPFMRRVRKWSLWR